MKSVTPDYKEAMREWREEHPLRLWRKEHNMSMRETAGLFGVNLFTVQGWENGTSTPNASNMITIIEHTKDRNMLAKWNEWYGRGPRTDGR